MTEHSDTHLSLTELFFSLLENTITDIQLSELKRMLQEDPDNRQLYVELALLCSALRKHSRSAESPLVRFSFDDDKNARLWEALAHIENTGVRIEIEAEETGDNIQALPVRKQFVKSPPRQISKVALSTALVSIAILTGLLLYCYFHPRQLPQVVASYGESLNAVWECQHHNTEPGDHIYSNDNFIKLLGGISGINFEDGTSVIVQSPAEFKIESKNQAYVKKGVLSVSVPQGRAGFIVRTPGATVVDYGTEYGVIVEERGKTEAHVFAGKVALRRGSDPVLSEESVMLQTGQAGMVTDDGSIRIISVRHQSFVKHFSRDGIIETYKTSQDPRAGFEELRLLFSDNFDNSALDKGKWLQVDGDNRSQRGLFAGSGRLTTPSGSYALVIGDFTNFMMSGTCWAGHGVMGIFVRSDGTVGSGIRIEFWPGGIGGQWNENVLTIMSGDRSVTYANKPWPGEKFDFQSTAFIWKLTDNGNRIEFTVQRMDKPQHSVSVIADVGSDANGSKILLGCDERGTAANCSYDDIKVYSLDTAD